MSTKYTTKKNSKPNIITFKLSDYDLDKDEKEIKYKNYNIILCEKCNEKINNRDLHCKKCYNYENDEEKYRMLYGRCKGCFQVMKLRFWCSSCNSKRFQDDFDKWTSGNENVDKLIKDIQTSAYSKHILEWIPYDKFVDVNNIDSGGFAEVYSATRKGGRIEKWDHDSINLKRLRSYKIA